MIELALALALAWSVARHYGGLMDRPAAVAGSDKTATP